METKGLRVDFHTHIIPEDLPNFVEKYGGEQWPIMQRTCTCGANILVGGKVFRQITDQCWDAHKRITDMNREGVDIQVLSPIPVTFSYWASSSAGLEMARIQNDFIAATVQAHPERFLGLGTVPLQDVSVAIKEMERALSIGLSGIEIGSNVNGHNLDDPQLNDFFAEVERLQVPIFVHPWATLGRERMPRHNFMYMVGMPSETALAAASLIWSGMLDRYPNLKICFAHGGGSLPYILPRLDQGWKVWPHLRQSLDLPSTYARKLYYDTLVYDPLNIRYMLERFGTSQLIAGSDYPFLLREIPNGLVIDEMLDLSQQDKQAILGKNALRFLGLEKDSRFVELG